VGLQRSLCCSWSMVVRRVASRMPSRRLQTSYPLFARHRCPFRPSRLLLWPSASDRRLCGWVPLLLLPGSHVRSDVPGLARRLRGGRRPQPAPPALPGRLAAAAGLVARPPCRRNISRAGKRCWCTTLSERDWRAATSPHFDTTLRRRLAAALVPADHLHHYTPPHRSSALPLALAANRMSESLQHRLVCSSANGDSFGFDHVLPPLLEHSRCRANLLQLLTALP